MAAQTLEREMKTYRDKLPELVANEGKHVLIKGDQIVDIFDTYQDALRSGYEKFKLEPFLVRRISSTEMISYFTRDIICPTSAA